MNENLLRGQANFGNGPLFAREPGDDFEVDGVRFRCDYASGSTATSFFIVKQVAHVTEYVERCRQHAGGVLVELGIAEGGSAALGLLEARPRRFVAFDLEVNRLEALDEFVAARDLGEVFSAHYGVDQGDRDLLLRLVTDDLHGEPIDVVFDDASHVLGPTRSSFEVLFPLVRPRGTYVIEDWGLDVRFHAAILPHLRSLSPEERAEAFRSAATSEPESGADAAPVERPLMDLAIELLLVHAAYPNVIAQVAFSEHGMTITRGDRPLDRSFRLRELVHDQPAYLS